MKRIAAMISASTAQPPLPMPMIASRMPATPVDAQRTAGDHELVRAVNTLLSIQMRSAAALEVAHLEDDATLTRTRAHELLA